MSTSATHPVERWYAAASPTTWLALIVLIAAALRIAFWSHLWGSDDLNYVWEAYREWQGPWTPLAEGEAHSHHSLRKGLILPIALGYAVFGVNGVGAGAWSFLCSMGLVFVAHRMVRLIMKSEGAGLAAALLTAAFPLSLIFATVPWPTEPQAFFMSLGMYVFLRAEARRSSDDGPRASEYLLAGIWIGVGYLVHITAIYLALFFGAYIIAYWRRFRWQLLMVGVGVLSVIVIEQAAYFAWHGEWLYTFKATDRSQNIGTGWGYIRNWEGTSQLIEGTVLASFFVGPLSMALINQEFALYYVVGFPAMIYVALRVRAAWPVLIWFISQWIWIAYGTTSPSTWVWLARMPRYYSPLTVTLIALIAAMAFDLWRRGRKTLSTAIVVITALSGIGGGALDDGTNTQSIGTIVDRMEAEPDTVWASDHVTYSVARFYAGFDPLPRLRALTVPPTMGGVYAGAKVQQFRLEDVDRVYLRDDQWDLAIRQPENCGAADKSGDLRPDCAADALLAEIRAWGEPEPIAVKPRRLICAPLEVLGGLVPERVTQMLCAPRVTWVYSRPGARPE